MKKRLLFTIIGLIVVISVIVAVKALQIGAMIDSGRNFVPPPQTVTSTVAKIESWETFLNAVGTLIAVQGVTVAAELAGKVVDISFEAGRAVKKGDILLRQDTSTEKAQLPGALAQVKLARINLERVDQLYAKDLISQVECDNAVVNAEEAEAEADNIYGPRSPRKQSGPPLAAISASARSTWARF